MFAASVVLLAFVAGIAGTTLGLVRQSRRRSEAGGQKAETARAEAQAKEAEATAVVKFFEDKVSPPAGRG